MRALITRTLVAITSLIYVHAYTGGMEKTAYIACLDATYTPVAAFVEIVAAKFITSAEDCGVRTILSSTPPLTSLPLKQGACHADSYLYSFFVNDGSQSTCQCSQTSPSASAIRTSGGDINSNTIAGKCSSSQASVSVACGRALGSS
jgi:hypothetical protein